jgi:hypothetical protein
MTTISNFTTDLRLNLINNISGPRMILPDNDDLGLRIVSIDGSNIEKDFLTVNTQNNNIFLNKMTSITGLNVTHDLNVNGVFAINDNQPFSSDGIIQTSSILEATDGGIGALVISEGGAFIKKRLYAMGGGFQPGGGNWSDSSDKRIKKNIVDINVEDCIESINNMKLKNYNYIDEYASNFNVDKRRQIGLIADELMETHPHLVKILDEKFFGLDNFKTINLSQTQYEMIGCIQHLLKENKQLKEDIEMLKQKL